MNDQKRTADAVLKTSLRYTQEFFDMWTKNCQSMFGKTIPALGPMREKEEKMMESFPVYLNLYNTWIESNLNFQSVFMEAMKKTYERTIDKTLECDASPEKYKEFYQIWIDTYSETFKEFMKSGHFSSDMGKIMSHFVDFQKYNRDMLEENFLKPGNLPTKTEIDEINKELYSLKKTIKELNNKIKELSKTSESEIKE